jgi:RimJ/RimL family protein N-acetyltransferase
MDFVNRINKMSEDSGAVVIGQERLGKIVAAVRYDTYNTVSIMMHIAAEGSRWMTRDFLWKCFDYPFVQLGLKKIIAPTEEGNLKARKFIENIGFVLEHKIEDACETGAVFIYTMTPNQCRFIGKDHGKKILTIATASS